MSQLPRLETKEMHQKLRIAAESLKREVSLTFVS